jgi:hypothetical protein
MGMERIGDSFGTPIFMKTESGEWWPEDEEVFYILAREGLLLCRNHPFFKSCVTAPRSPAGLEKQEPFLEPAFPRLPLFRAEQVVGFFDAVWRVLGGEAVVLLGWDRTEERVEVIVPRQVSTVSRSWRGWTYPVGVEYEVPAGLPGSIAIFCDIHSHCDYSVDASRTDIDDETYRAGLHAIVGRLDHEPPQFQVEAVVDGNRFRLDQEAVFEGYRRRCPAFPRSWLRNVEVRIRGSRWREAGR